MAQAHPVPRYNISELSDLDLVSLQDNHFPNRELPTDKPIRGDREAIFLILFDRDPMTLQPPEHWGILRGPKVDRGWSLFNSSSFFKEDRAAQQGCVLYNLSTPPQVVPQYQRRRLTADDLPRIRGKIRVSKINPHPNWITGFEAVLESMAYPFSHPRENLSLRWCLEALYQLRYTGGFALRIWHTQKLLQQIDGFRAWLDGPARLEDDKIGVMIDSRERDYIESMS